MKKAPSEQDSFYKKIEKMYHNYGIDTSNMSEEEFERIKVQYLSSGKSIEQDIKNSEKFKEQFADDIV